MDIRQFNDVIEVLERSDDIQLADSLELIGADNIEAISVLIDNMRQANKPEAQVTDYVVHDVTGFLENEEGFKPFCAEYQLQN